jgi:hypothetical protein
MYNSSVEKLFIASFGLGRRLDGWQWSVEKTIPKQSIEKFDCKYLRGRKEGETFFPTLPSNV